ncbi:MAG: hypothetical protein UU15_C0012G0001, partial [Candidatus Levybacteria bacterium GW2011_GWC2_40_7]
PEDKTSTPPPAPSAPEEKAPIQGDDDVWDIPAFLRQKN